MMGTESVNAAADIKTTGRRPNLSARAPANSADANAPITTAPTTRDNCASENEVVAFIYGNAAEITPMSMPYRSPASPAIANRNQIEILPRSLIFGYYTISNGIDGEIQYSRFAAGRIAAKNGIIHDGETNGEASQ